MQAATIQSLKLQREALRLSRFAYLDPLGAAELCDAAAKLESAIFLLRMTAQSVRLEYEERRANLPRRVA